MSRYPSTDVDRIMILADVTYVQPCKIPRIRRWCGSREEIVHRNDGGDAQLHGGAVWVAGTDMKGVFKVDCSCRIITEGVWLLKC